MTPPRLFSDNLIFKRPMCCDPATLSNAATRTLCIVFLALFTPVSPVLLTSCDRQFLPILLFIIMFRKRDGGIRVIAKKRSVSGTFFENHYKTLLI